MQMDALRGKFAMDRSNKLLEISGEPLIDIQKFLRADGMFCEVEVVRRLWHIFCLDDKSIFGEDAHRLAAAFQCQGAISFFVGRADDILGAKASVIVHRFEATQEGVEEFQSPAFWHLNLDDCFLFNLPVTCVVFRPGNVGVTIFAGDAAFVGQMKNLN